MTSLSETSVLAGSSGVSTGYTIDQSIRFNDNDSAYMQRTHGAGGNVDLFTVSFWFKRSTLGTEQYMFGSGANVYNTSDIMFNTSDQLSFWSYISAYQTRLITTQVFRDTSAWYHVVIIYNSGNAVSTDRARMYINGKRVTDFGTETYPSQNQDGIVGSNANIGFGRYISYGTGYFDGYLAEMHYINGYGYGPEYFGEFKSDTDIWIPKEYTESYGTGGFKVDGRDSSDLGDDESGQGNDLTTSGLAANDQRTDSPTNNHCVMNPLVPGSATFANGNLDLSYSTSAWTTARGSIGIPYNSGIYYYEAKVISHSIYLSFGWGDVDMGANQNNNPATPKFFIYGDYNGKYYSSTDDGTIGDAWDNNDVIGLWYDSGSTSNNLKFYRNGTLQSSGTKSFDFSDVAHVTAITQLYSSNSAEFRFDPAYWTNAPSGITSDNAITTNNVGS